MAEEAITVERVDTGTIAEVPEDERLDVDGGQGSDATGGELDDNLADVYADPGEVRGPFA